MMWAVFMGAAMNIVGVIVGAVIVLAVKGAKEE